MLRAALASLAICAAAPPAGATPSGCRGDVTGATYDAPTDRYPHGALGDPFEYTTLSYSLRLARPCQAGNGRGKIVLPPELVFEDVPHPRLADLDGDGSPEILTVESHRQKGARVAVYASDGAQVARIATTPFIGQRFRWLALIGAMDLDGDGAIEIAYVDRPHLAKTLRVWRWDNGRLQEVAALPGLTNHRFGARTIEGGFRHCPGHPPEMVTADATWGRVIATRLTDTGLSARDIGAYSGPDSLTRALACKRP